MAGQVVEMDYTVIGQVATGFTQVGETVRQIGKTTHTIIDGLLKLPFVSMTVGPILQMIQQAVDKKSEELGKTCDEFSTDLNQAIQDHRNGDYEGKSYFGKG